MHSARRSPMNTFTVRSSLMAMLIAFTLMLVAKTLSRTLERATNALRSDDLAAFTSINVQEITPQEATVSNLLERFQDDSSRLGQDPSAQRESECRTVEALVSTGFILALLLVAAMHGFLKRSVPTPA